MAGQEALASDLVYIFIDYSNVILGSHNNLNIKTDFFNVDPNRLIITVCNGRRLGKVFIAGSHPPPENDLWTRAKELGFNVNIFPRNNSQREKKVDVYLACKMTEIMFSKSPGILVLVSGDADFTFPLNEAKEKNWRIEIWSWSKGISSDLKEFPYTSLNVHYKSFAYITEFDSSKPTLEISGEIIKSWKWKNETIMECFRALNLLCRFYWVDDKTACLYFDDKDDLKQARGWLSKSYPNMLTNVANVVNDDLDDPYEFVDFTQSIIMHRE